MLIFLLPRLIRYRVRRVNHPQYRRIPFPRLPMWPLSHNGIKPVIQTKGMSNFMLNPTLKLISRSRTGIDADNRILGQSIVIRVRLAFSPSRLFDRFTIKGDASLALLGLRSLTSDCQRNTSG